MVDLDVSSTVARQRASRGVRKILAHPIGVNQGKEISRPYRPSGSGGYDSLG